MHGIGIIIYLFITVIVHVLISILIRNLFRRPCRKLRGHWCLHNIACWWHSVACTFCLS